MVKQMSDNTWNVRRISNSETMLGCNVDKHTAEHYARQYGKGFEIVGNQQGELQPWMKEIMPAIRRKMI